MAAELTRADEEISRLRREKEELAAEAVDVASRAEKRRVEEEDRWKKENAEKKRKVDKLEKALAGEKLEAENLAVAKGDAEVRSAALEEQLKQAHALVEELQSEKEELEKRLRELSEQKTQLEREYEAATRDLEGKLTLLKRTTEKAILYYQQQLNGGTSTEATLSSSTYEGIAGVAAFGVSGPTKSKRPTAITINKSLDIQRLNEVGFNNENGSHSPNMTRISELRAGA